MIFCTYISQAFETTSTTPGQEHLEGIIEISFDPPENLEVPGLLSDMALTLDLVLIESDNCRKLQGKRLQWDRALWKIEMVEITSKNTRNLWIKRIKDLI